MNVKMLDFSGKVVFLTGGGGEIGARTSELFLRRGAKVVTTDIDFPVLNGSVDFEVNPVKIALDVTDRKRVEAIIAATVKNCGRVDVVVNAAGVLNIKPFLEISEQEWERTFAVNVKGMFFVCQEALKRMIEQKAGCFINFASISGKVGGVLAGADYSASKAAVICLTKSLAKVGGFEQNHPLGRFGRAEEVASTVLFLASDQASYITGSCLDINGGTLMD
jgi:NAD(P)-dependent dehydrogenase (short-subunit alcohol dehydrogenase family)